MSYQWNYDTINQVHIELSTYCNAACPMCPRHVVGPDQSALPIVRPELVLESITYENFIKWFPEDFAKKVNMWVLCGTHGDPMMNKDILKIVRYICETGGSIWANTNGGMRDKEFWKELAEITQINKKPYSERLVIFSMDGLWDTNHLYRRNVPFEKAVGNAKAYIDAGGAASWDYLIFKHNEHQIDEAEKLSKELGFRYFVPKKALGFDPPTNRTDGLIAKTVRNKDGSFAYMLEPPTEGMNVNHNKDLVKIEKRNPENFCFNVDEFMENRNTKKDYEHSRKKYLEILDSNYEPTEAEKSTNIVCKSHVACKQDYQQHEIYVDAYGNVFPCCYVGTNFSANFNIPTNYQLTSEIVNFGLEKISLKNHSLKEIIESGYLQHTFEDKWGKSWPQGMLFCNETCGEKSLIDKIFTHEKDNRPDEFKTHQSVSKKRMSQNV